MGRGDLAEGNVDIYLTILASLEDHMFVNFNSMGLSKYEINEAETILEEYFGALCPNGRPNGAVVPEQVNLGPFFSLWYGKDRKETRLALSVRDVLTNVETPEEVIAIMQEVIKLRSKMKYFGFSFRFGEEDFSIDFSKSVQVMELRSQIEELFSAFPEQEENDEDSLTE
jgi:hypothetical protein